MDSAPFGRATLPSLIVTRISLIPPIGLPVRDPKFPVRLRREFDRKLLILIFFWRRYSKRDASIARNSLYFAC
jgi:hypothetical protein